MPTVPPEILRAIGTCLDFCTLLNLCRTSSTTFSLLYDILSNEKKVRQRYRQISVERSDGCPQPYHELLQDFLRDERLASYVVSFGCDELINDSTPEHPENRGLFYCPHESSAELQSRYALDAALLRCKVEQVSCVFPAEREAFVERIIHGGIKSEVAVLIVLLYMMKEVRFIRPPLIYEREPELQTHLDRLCLEYKQKVNLLHNEIPGSRTNGLAMNKLLIVECQVNNGLDGMDLADTFVWIGLPSVRRIHIPYCRTERLRSPYPVEYLFPRLSEVFLFMSNVTQEAVRDYARSISTACVIRQTYSQGDGYYDNGPLTWDHYTITGQCGNDMAILPSSRQERIELRYPGSELHEASTDCFYDEVLASPLMQTMYLTEDRQWKLTLEPDDSH